MMMTFRLTFALATTVHLLCVFTERTTAFSTSSGPASVQRRTINNQIFLSVANEEDDASVAASAAAVLIKARDVAFADDADFNEHYHPYRDEDALLEEAMMCLQEIRELPAATEDLGDGATTDDIVYRLQEKVDRYQRRVAKRQG
jgi:hypothetical protein